MYAYLARFCLSTVHFVWLVRLERVWAFKEEMIYRRKTTPEIWKKINEIPPYTQVFGLDDAITYQENSKKVEGCVFIILVNCFSQVAAPKISSQDDFYNLECCPWYNLQDLSEGFAVCCYIQYIYVFVVVWWWTGAPVWQEFCFYCEVTISGEF